MLSWERSFGYWWIETVAVWRMNDTKHRCTVKAKSFVIEAVATDVYPIIFVSCFVCSCTWLVSDRIRLECRHNLDLVSSWRLMVRTEESHEQPRSRMPVLLARFRWGLPWECVDSVTATLNVVSSPTALIHPIPLNMTLLTVIVAGALSYTRLHPPKWEPVCP